MSDQPARKETTNSAWSLTYMLRWRVPPDTTTKPPTLEQAWLCMETGEMKWEAVQTVVVQDQPCPSK